jgi:hypothetical protein
MASAGLQLDPATVSDRSGRAGHVAGEVALRLTHGGRKLVGGIARCERIELILGQLAYLPVVLLRGAAGVSPLGGEAVDTAANLVVRHERVFQLLLFERKIGGCLRYRAGSRARSPTPPSGGALDQA